MSAPRRGGATRYEAVLPNRPRARRDGLNARLHWVVRARRARYWREVITYYLREAGFPRVVPAGGAGYRVRITVQQALGPLPDDDNRLGMCKGVRDAVAAFLGASDAPGGIQWCVEWRRGEDQMRIELDRAPAGAET